MQGRYFATFGSSQLEEFDIPGGPMSVMLVSEVGQTEEEFRASLSLPPFYNKYCTTYPLEMAHDYDMTEYSLEKLLSRRI